MSETATTIGDKYVESAHDPKGPGEIAAESAKEGTNAVIRGWRRIIRYINREK